MSVAVRVFPDLSMEGRSTLNVGGTMHALGWGTKEKVEAKHQHSVLSTPDLYRGEQAASCCCPGTVISLP